MIGPSPGQDPHQAIHELTGILVRTLRALGKAGAPSEASRLAARAWWLLREPAPDAAEHVNGVMHYLARLPGHEDPPSPQPHPTGPSLKETQHVPGT